jgi:tetratricopeptide (TPR) repeat protein
MKRISILLLILIACIKLSAQVAPHDTIKTALPTIHTDSLKKPPIVLTHADSVLVHRRDSAKMALIALNLTRQAKLMSIDTIRQWVKNTKVDTLRAPLYTELASRYMVFDTLNEAKNLQNQNTALTYTMLALHQYMAYSDAIGMRISYNNLAKLYLQQKRYSEAKWYNLQSAELSRNRNDVVNIISSLLILADIKGQIGDYKLAQKDLNEALALAIKKHDERLQLQIIKSNALLHSRMKDYTKEDLMLKKQEALQKKMNKEAAPVSTAKPKKGKPAKKTN